MGRRYVLTFIAAITARGSVMSVAMHPDADLALTGRLWQLPRALPDQPALIEKWTRLATQRTFSSGNNVQWLSPEEVVQESSQFAAQTGHSWAVWPNEPR